MLARSLRFVFASLILLGSVAVTEAAEKPNVIVIYTDDQGTVDANCYGSEELVTPGIDRLAKTGIRFTQFYAPAPVCSPSRAGLLTGRYPVRAGVPGNVSSSKGKSGMPADRVTIAETFKSAGYRTAHIGKWHLGYTPETMPNGQGFDHSFGHMGGCIDNYSHFFYWAGPNRHDLWRNGEEVYERGFFPDLMVKEAIRFIDDPAAIPNDTFDPENTGKPFFIYFAMNTPHYPYQGEPEWLTHYAEQPYPRNLYAAFVTTLDARIDRLIKHLERTGQRENTIIVFQSDHGHSCEQRAHFGGGSAGPYRGAKFSLFEGGIRVPTVISWPGGLPQGEVRDGIGHGCDWLPTLVELCDIELVETDIDGKSLVPMLKDKTANSPHGVLHWTIGKSWAVRDGDWKLLGAPRDTNLKTQNRSPLGDGNSLFLVNLADDPGESKNLADTYPEQVKRLKKLHDDWAKSVVK